MPLTENKLLTLLNSVDSDTLYFPNGTTRDVVKRKEKVILATINKFEINGSLRLDVEIGKGFQDGSLTSMARIVDTSLIKTTPNGSAKSIINHLYGLEKARVLDVLFSKFGNLVTIVVHDEERASPIRKKIEEVLVSDRYEIIKYSSIKDLNYSGNFDFPAGLTWFDRFFSDVFIF